MKYFLTAALCAALCLSACATAPTASTTTSAAPAAFGATASAGNLTITGAWARPALAMKLDVGAETAGTPTAGQGMDGPVSAAYMKIENAGAADTLTSVATTAAEITEIHQTKESNGMMMMEPLPGGLEIPANGAVELKPGSYHIMLMNIKQDLTPGANISLTLKFQSGQQIVMAVPVREN